MLDSEECGSPASSSPAAGAAMEMRAAAAPPSSSLSSGTGSPRCAGAAEPNGAGAPAAPPLLKADRAWVFGEGIIHEPIYKTDEFRCEWARRGLCLGEKANRGDATSSRAPMT